MKKLCVSLFKVLVHEDVVLNAEMRFVVLKVDALCYDEEADYHVIAEDGEWDDLGGA